MWRIGGGADNPILTPFAASGWTYLTNAHGGNAPVYVALVRQTAGWGSIPVAFYNGDGSWNVTNGAAPNFIPAWANQPGVRLVGGDLR